MLCRQAGSYLASGNSKDDFDVARDILRYFTRNPQAADTVEGVARWRLLDERIHSDLERVTRAMAWLVSRGLLVKEPLAGSAAIFRLNDKEPREIERFLQKRKRWSKKGKK